MRLFFSFDDETNRQANAELMKNVQGVVDHSSKDSSSCDYTPSLIKRNVLAFVFTLSCIGFTCIGALRTYFKSKKSRHHRVALGKHLSDAADARKRQRRHNVSFNLNTT